MMNRAIPAGILFVIMAALLVCAAPPEGDKTPATQPPDGWTTAAPRPEVSPAFAYDKGVFVITADKREGLDGWWTKTFPVTGSKHYHFTATYQTKNVAVPRRSVIVKINWQDAQGKKVPLDEPVPSGYLRGATPQAETEFPTTRGTFVEGGTEISDTYQAPAKAARAGVERPLQWSR